MKSLTQRRKAAKQGAKKRMNKLCDLLSAFAALRENYYLRITNAGSL